MMKVIKQKLKDDEEAKQTTRIDISLVLRETKSLNKPRNPASFPFNDVPAGANNNETDMPPVSSLECISSEVSTASTMSSLSYSSQDGNARHSQVTSSSPRPHGQRNICKEHDHQENESSRIFSRDLNQLPVASPRPVARPREVSMDVSATARPAKKQKLQVALAPKESSKYTSDTSTATNALSACSPSRPSSSVILLGREEDKEILNPLHAFVRTQIEVFTATATELSQPAPGRKQPIKLHQVGLRCIHCKHAKKRVKRAVCYPSAVGRVYHSVSDMKFDHFSNCRELPPDVRAIYDSLKADPNCEKKPSSNKGNTNVSTSTAQYYHDSAIQLGMVDGPGGIFMSPDYHRLKNCKDQEVSKSVNGASMISWSQSLNSTPMQTLPSPQPRAGQLEANVSALAMLRPFSLSRIFASRQDSVNMFPALAADTNPVAMQSFLANAIFNVNSKNVTAASFDTEAQRKQPLNIMSSESQEKPTVKETAAVTAKCSVALASPEDSDYLNPLHCFVRKHVELFIANKDDVAAPAPGRKNRVVLGQVGIRCIHCAKLPLKQRVKRAACYPPSVQGIYHAVSNMKFDHFSLCHGLPSEAREEFTLLKNSCSRRGTAGNNYSASSLRSIASSSSSSGTPSSTAQYYYDSAVAKGLVDTESGIRFSEESHVTGEMSPEKSIAAETSPPLKDHGKQTKDDVAYGNKAARKSNLYTGLSVLMLAASQAV